jgi:hypothetical protein
LSRLRRESFLRTHRSLEFDKIIKNDRGLKITLKKKSGKGIPVSKFLICHRRKNRPQVSPQICEKRCRHRYRCPAFFEYLQPPLFDESATPAVEPLRKQKKGRRIAAEEEKNDERFPDLTPQRLF